MEPELTQARLLGEVARQRMKLGLSQAELAERIGTSRMTVVRAEGPDADPQLSTFVKMACALGVPLSVASAEESSASAPTELVHRGVAHSRTKRDSQWRDCQRERALANAWEKANRVTEAGQPPLLPVLLSTCSQSQASACATVVQWLGSDVGFDFLQRALSQAGYAIVDKRA